MALCTVFMIDQLSMLLHLWCAHCGAVQLQVNLCTLVIRQEQLPDLFSLPGSPTVHISVRKAVSAETNVRLPPLATHDRACVAHHISALCTCREHALHDLVTHPWSAARVQTSCGQCWRALLVTS